MKWVAQNGGRVLELTGAYDIILADPPWDYADKGCNGAARPHYLTTETDTLAKLPVGDLGSANSVMFMWGTYPKLPDAIELFKAWGYTYKSIAFQWLKIYPSGKPRFGLGRWTRGNTEPCLLGVRGKPHRVDNAVSQLIFTEELIVAEIGRHSAKPPETREKIIRLMGDLPAIELFAREPAPGWDCWGNEVDGKVRLV
jgi:N6-adenosine-specific RNA methylase IME4